MAVTTQTSKGFWPTALRWHGADKSIGTWFGLEVPPGVVAIEEWLDPFYYDQWIGWKTADGQTHKMPVDLEHKEAVIIAMKLTC